MKRISAIAVASLFASSAAVLTAPAVHAQSAEAMSEAQASQLASGMNHSSLNAAVQAGDIVAVEGGYALTSAGVAKASAAGLLVSPALIPIAIGFGVAIVGIGIVAVSDDDSAAQAAPQTAPATAPATAPPATPPATTPSS